MRIILLCLLAFSLGGCLTTRNESRTYWYEDGTIEEEHIKEDASPVALAVVSGGVAAVMYKFWFK